MLSRGVRQLWWAEHTEAWRRARIPAKLRARVRSAQAHQRLSHLGINNTVNVKAANVNGLVYK